LLEVDKLGERRALCGFGVLCDVGRAESLSDDVWLDEEVVWEAAEEFLSRVPFFNIGISRSLKNQDLLGL
jgi:hypothetical protein